MTHPRKTKETFVDDDGTRKVPADSDIGTTHDPNSVTTGTESEPDDAHPPKTGD